jgi:hypothetical protein
MQLRRGLLVFAIFLLAVSFGAAITAPDEDQEPATTTPQTARSNSPTAVALALRHPVRGKPPVRRADVNAHVALTISARVAGNVEIGGLGLIQAVAPGTPTTFDILAVRPGRYPVELVPTAGERLRLGTLVVADA